MKKIKTTPVIESRLLENVTKDRLTALSMSSMLIKITMTFQRSITPSTPIVNSRTLNSKMCSMGIINNYLMKFPLCNHYSANNGNEQENYNNFK